MTGLLGNLGLGGQQGGANLLTMTLHELMM